MAKFFCTALHGVGLVVVAATATCVSAEGAAGATARVASSQRLAVLLTVHGARSRPSLDGHLLEVVQPHRPLTGEQTVLPVIARARGPRGAPWLRVLLPGRPNGLMGWIREAGTRSARTSWAIAVNLAQRKVLTFWRGKEVRAFSAVVGKPSTPTPRGRFFVEESFPIRQGYPGSPYALALSARSDVFQEFDGGPGQIALHGVYGIGGVPGTAVSHGCIRLDTTDMAWLGARIHQGVPVTIFG